MTEIFIQKSNDKREIALVEEDKLIEYYEENENSNRNEGNIYIGIVRDIIKGMEAAFVDIGTNKNSFIHLKDILPKVDETKTHEEQKLEITDVIKPKQKILVQVKKDSNSKKGARVSTHINLPSKYIVLMPNTDIITISQKIEDKKEQEENRKFYGDSYLCYYEKKVINEITKREQTKLIEANAELELPLPEAQLVFVKDNGQFLGTDSPKYAFKVIHYELGINSRFHDFRDTHATKLIESGADIKAVSKRLGHSTIQTTYNIYVRVTNKMESDTVDRFEKYTTTLDIPQTAEIPYQV